MRTVRFDLYDTNTIMRALNEAYHYQKAFAENKRLYSKPYDGAKCFFQGTSYYEYHPDAEQFSFIGMYWKFSPRNRGLLFLETLLMVCEQECVSMATFQMMHGIEGILRAIETTIEILENELEKQN